MKKIILFVVLTTLSMSFNSCSSDDSGKQVPVEALNPVGTISFKVNGVTKAFDTFIMTEDESTLFITATIGSSIDDIVELQIQKDALGTQVLDRTSFTYTRNTVDYRVDSNFTSLITTNSNRQIMGSFAGDMYVSDANLTLTNGSINMSY